jgi:hypothetical protein
MWVVHRGDSVLAIDLIDTETKRAGKAQQLTQKTENGCNDNIPPVLVSVY